MERLVINGGKKLSGTVQTGGAKNAALPILAASLLSNSACVLRRIPDLMDIRSMKEVLSRLGSKITCQAEGLLIDNRQIAYSDIDDKLIRQIRASNLVIGPLLSRFGYVRISTPGGCNIGSRPMDLHLKGMQQMGAQISESHGYLILKAQQLQGTEINLDFPSVGATQNLMMAAVLAAGTTVINNAAQEPEIVDLQNFLISMGARVRNAGSSKIIIQGVKLSELHGSEYTIIPDRIEAGTFAIGAALLGETVRINDCCPEHLSVLITKLREAGSRVINTPDALIVSGSKMLRAVDIKTMPYPGFPTDLQPQMLLLDALAQGTSIISETIFESRFKHVAELCRMGAHIKVEGSLAVISGVPQLSGTTVEASDLRAGAALVLAGLAASGQTVINNVYHIDRGYENLEKKFSLLGADITRILS